MRSIVNGVWPTMLTFFDSSGKVDYTSMERLTEWYIKSGVDGIFSVCQSSEMFFLSEKERLDIARFVVKTVNGRIPVIASGHVSENIDDQIDEIKMMQDTGVDLVVMLTNRQCSPEENDEIWIKNTQKILDSAPESVFGLYECPYPYKRLLSDRIVKWCVESGKFLFLKDTCCDIDIIKTRLNLTKGSALKLFNANTATLLDSYVKGAAGFCGVMANFHPDLYVWIDRNIKSSFFKAYKLQMFLTTAALIERQLYPVNAKYYLTMKKIGSEIYTRSRDVNLLTKAMILEIDHLECLADIFREYVGLV